MNLERLFIQKTKWWQESTTYDSVIDLLVQNMGHKEYWKCIYCRWINGDVINQLKSCRRCKETRVKW